MINLGGGSALLPLPIDALSLEEEIQLIKLLQSKGANIQELNTVRQAMSQLKNGGLVRISKATTIIGLILSDVIGDPLEFIASGPTFYSGNKNRPALDIFNKYDLINHIPTRFLQHLKENENTNNDQNISSIKQIHNIIVGSNRIALEAAAHLCHQSLAYVPFIATTSLQGEAREVGRRIIELVTTKSSQLIYNDNIACLFSDQSTFDAFQKLTKEYKHYCLLLGGETTVIMKNDVGKGGRCQELALSAALTIDNNNEDTSIILLAAGSDGIDGPTDAAGAFAYNGMITNEDDIKRAHISLDKHDTYTYFSETNDGANLLKSGHTSTNVMDIIIVLVDNKE
ncbi:unnamed protein product [Rotaria sp. Silwood1]|nr:unnamed protein product [Rotaria sp. Silwood1]CAF1168483.1 unnamed protein product [Rotaria sp. Silwood1]CAF3433622.1 unnamed protein product [Rotaria sp. Silwood1]CAF4592552.1 unnamed protein product [Rotaria sp. Silwood1]CAF4604069.1 unnamed protein product [Rotaria sp. Silwood1]